MNGSHAYGLPPLDPGSTSLGLASFHKSLPMSTSLQNLSPRALTDPSKGPAGDGRRWSFDKPGEEEKAAIAAALQQSGPMLGGDELDERLGRADPAKAASVASEAESQGKKQKKNTAGVAEEKHKGWFGSKDLHSKPR